MGAGKDWFATDPPEVSRIMGLMGLMSVIQPGSSLAS
jgi:hypothetical protein